MYATISNVHSNPLTRTLSPAEGKQAAAVSTASSKGTIAVSFSESLKAADQFYSSMGIGSLVNTSA